LLRVVSLRQMDLDSSVAFRRASSSSSLSHGLLHMSLSLERALTHTHARGRAGGQRWLRLPSPRLRRRHFWYSAKETIQSFVRVGRGDGARRVLCAASDATYPDDEMRASVFFLLLAQLVVIATGKCIMVIHKQRIRTFLREKRRRVCVCLFFSSSSLDPLTLPR